MKEIFIASSVHPWNDLRIYLKEAVSLSKKYHVELHAPAEFKHKKIGQIDVYGLPKWKKIKDRKLNRKIIFQRALKKKNFIFHFHDPELIPLALSIKFLRNAKIVYDVHEDVPRQILTKPYINKKIIKLISILFETFEVIASIFIDALIVTTTEIFNRFSKKNMAIIRNYPLLDDIDHHDNWSDKKDEIVYIGGIFRLRGTLEILKAIEDVDVRFNLAGTIFPDCFRQELMNSKGWEKTRYLGFVNRDQMNVLFSRSKIGMLILRPDKCYMEVLPVKLFEYMIAGIPTIASKFSKLESIIDKHECGICVDPMDTEAITKAIKYLLSNPNVCKKMGENGRKAVLNEYNWNIQEKKLYKLYDRLT